MTSSPVEVVRHGVGGFVRRWGKTFAVLFLGYSILSQAVTGDTNGLVMTLAFALGFGVAWLVAR